MFCKVLIGLNTKKGRPKGRPIRCSEHPLAATEPEFGARAIFGGLGHHREWASLRKPTRFAMGFIP